MKGEHVEDHGDHHHHHHNYNSHSHLNLFSKFPSPHLHNHNHPPIFQPSPFPPPSEEADSATTVAPTSKKPKTTIPTTTTTSEEGGTIEVSRRPRGRPPGSKNKPRPPIVITREPEPAMSPYILEIPGGSDIIESLTRFTRRRGIGLCVLTASGSVANVTLKHPTTAAPGGGGTVMFHGRFDILSLSGVLMVQTMPFNNGELTTFSISLAGPQGQIVGGKVVGPLLASSVVYIIATSFNSPSYHRLSVDDQQIQDNPSTDQSSSPVSGGGDGSGSGGGGGGGRPMGMYSCQMGSAASTSDVIWAPSARPPPPPY